LSKFVLEVTPLISAILIAAYLFSGLHWNPTSAETLATLPAPEAAVNSGEELTAMINAAHAAAILYPQTRQSAAAAEPVAAAASATPEPQRVAAPAPGSARMAARPPTAATTPAVAESSPIVPAAAVAAEAAAPAPPASEATWYGKTRGAVAGWGEKAVKVTRLDYAAGLVVDTPSAVMRAGRKTIGAVAGLIVPESKP
jgi:hypothetical protein